MATIKVNPEAELNWICVQNQVFPSTDLEFYDQDDNEENLDGYRVELIVKEYSGGAEILRWDTDESTISIEMGTTNKNIVRFGERDAGTMNITALKYLYEIYMTPPGGSRARKFYGYFGVEATI